MYLRQWRHGGTDELDDDEDDDEGGGLLCAEVRVAVVSHPLFDTAALTCAGPSWCEAVHTTTGTTIGAGF